jgi:hypothetical protein
MKVTTPRGANFSGPAQPPGTSSDRIGAIIKLMKSTRVPTKTDGKKNGVVDFDAINLGLVHHCIENMHSL